MPIFTSRFSPEKSLVGTFLSPRSRETDDAESRKEKRQTDSASTFRASDRLEIAGRQQAETVQVRSSKQTTEVRARETGQQDARQLNLRRALREAGRLERTPSEVPTPLPVKSTDTPFNAPAAEENRDASESALPPRLEALVSRLSDLRIERALQAIQNENADAAETAGPEPLKALVEQVGRNDQQGPTAVGPQEEESAVLHPERIDRLVERLQAQVAAPEREIQEADLRRDLQTIASGLQADAAVGNQRNVAQPARKAEGSTQSENQNTIRENQTEIRSLQSNRRSLRQEAQRTEQAIRQLQNETSQLRNSGSAAVTTSIDILAQ